MINYRGGATNRPNTLPIPKAVFKQRLASVTPTSPRAKRSPKLHHQRSERKAFRK